jgi:hypothetical protein
MVGHNLPPPPLDRDRVNVSENLGKAAADLTLLLTIDYAPAQWCFLSKETTYVTVTRCLIRLCADLI